MRVKTQKSLAKALRVSRATISKYVADGLQPEADGRFDVDKSRAWKDIAATRMKAGTSRTDAAQTSDEEYRKFKAAMMKQKFDISTGELVPRADVTREWAMRVLQVRDGFLYLGRELAPQLVGRSAREIQATIDKRAMQILGRLSADDPRAYLKKIIN